MYHFLVSENGHKNRVHLRIESDKSSVFLLNASTLLHLNPSATYMAYLLLNRIDNIKAINWICKLFSVTREQASKDLADFELQINTVLFKDDICPIHDMNLETLPPFSQQPSAPYRMDLALTYACNNDCSHCYNVKSRGLQEYSTEKWMRVLERIWNLSVPHVVFTGGEPTLRPDLPDLIAFAENLGLITGLNTNGRKLHDQKYVNSLTNAGLDHVQITIESHRAETHDKMVAHAGAWEQTIRGIQNAVKSKLYIMTNSTLLRTNLQDLSGLLDLLANLGVPTVGINALIRSGRGASVDTGLADEELSPLMKLAKEKTTEHHQKLIWYTPTRYCHFDPIVENLGIKGCTAALYNMCVEPDGIVIPCQSYYKPLGSILESSWDSIWNHPLSISLRERKHLPKECLNCSLVSVCGGGCPLAQDHNDPHPRGIPELDYFSKE